MDSRIPIRKKVAYGLPAFALAVVGVPVYVYIPKFYTDVVGIRIAVLGILLLSVRLFDAVTDPLFGYLSDKTTGFLGRRRPYIALGSVFVAIAMILLFNPPDATPRFETIWFGVCIYALFLFWTAVVVPYESLGPEITFDYHERTSLFALRDGLLIAGTLAAVSAPAVVAALFELPDSNAGERAKFFWISVFYTPLVIGSCWWCVYEIRERRPIFPLRQPGLFQGMRDVFRNRPFVILLVSYTISAVGNNLPATLILYYVEYVLQSKLAEVFLLVYFIIGIVCLPGWVALARRIGKKAAWLASMIINTGAFAGVFFLGPGDVLAYGILVFLSGIGFGATLALPSAIQADVIDYDELLTGHRREGQYIGLWNIFKKLAAAVGVGAGLFFLGTAGYIPKAVQSEEVIVTLRLLYAGVPSLCNLIAFMIALSYPIDGEVHRAIRESVENRQSGQPVVDPLRSVSA